MDALTALANGLNLRAKLVYAGGACGQWLMDHNSDKSIWFHLVGKGRGWVHSPAWAAPLELADGDLILFLPHAAQHFLSYSPAHLPGDMAGTRLTNWDQGEAGFVCGEIELAVPQSPLWRTLPAEIVIRKTEAGETSARLIQLVIAESASPRFGSNSVIERLCDSLFILVIRHCIEATLVRQGVFAAMQDRRLATVLHLIHQEPWHPWTIAEFCTRVGLSKTVLTDKFKKLIGASPVEYLKDWRMQIAAQWLKESGMTIDRVAERCGYDSVAAFSKAFKRCFGVSPGAYRRSSTAIPGRGPLPAPTVRGDAA
ncbi:AraC family transcriptional regulator [Bradyrhizobium sediminis]|uniref:AraC family transcriptional regulator n=1 Tax=Bradyrhizobium sediminis TaxID=2840469 RepID=A0A975NTN5_9BRAD|nr:AraC family transcriptional regulator [Bradyrhizobium sediminis]QWG21182.1 AraC family transcriptional regulator [Bradyrhizobium sediminis]